MQFKQFNLLIINVYAPTKQVDDEGKDEMHAKITQLYRSLRLEDTVIVMADFNAQIEKEAHLRKVARKHRIHDKTNNNGNRVHCNLGHQV